MPHKRWKTRLLHMKDSIGRIRKYCEALQSESDFAKHLQTFDACLRNFQVLGDAAATIPSSIRHQVPGIPWKEIVGMRNILVHEYFGVSPAIIWNTISNDLPRLELALDQALAHFNHPVHPWKICPPGEFYVREAVVKEHPRDGHLVRAHSRRDHCRESRESAKDTLTLHETQDIAETFFGTLSERPSPQNLGFGSIGTKYDSLIGGWTQYWNALLQPKSPLDPNIIKALIASESSFNASEGKERKSSARGLMQLMPVTRKALNGFRGELREHIFEFQDSDIFDPSLNIAAGVRWLFRKQELASRRLGREANWEEAVEEYKDYLRRRLKNPKTKQKGMQIFRKFLTELMEE